MERIKDICNLDIPDGAKWIIEKIEENGGEAYVIGGCTRDAILGRVPDDWDITTSLKAEKVISIFDSLCVVVPTGLKHGTVTLMVNKVGYEVTTYRIDGDYMDNRHPESVRFVTDLEEDLSRRDFTMNAIAYSPQKGFKDYHNGIEDIRNGMVRSIGNPRDRFSEDALRILRALRFSSQLGFTIEEDTFSAAEELRQRLKNVSYERIFVEITKLLLGKGAKSSLVQGRQILQEVIPLIGDYPVENYELAARSMEFVKEDSVLRWAAFLHYIEGKDFSKEKTNSLLDMMRASTVFRKRVLCLVENMDIPIPQSRPEVKRLLLKYGIQFAKDFASLKSSEFTLNGFDDNKVKMFLETLQDVLSCGEPYEIGMLAIDGNDLIKLGFKGTKIGFVLEKLLNEVIENPDKNRREVLLSLAKELG